MFALKYRSEKHFPIDDQDLWMKYLKTMLYSLGDVYEFEAMKATDVQLLWLSSEPVILS